MNRLPTFALVAADHLRVVDDFMGFYAMRPTTNQWRRFHDWALAYYAGAHARCP